MTLYSFIEDAFYLREISLEIQLVPGLPGIRILGQPDSIIKESQYRIISAFNACGFELPSSQQIIVNLRPSYGLKRSHGLDLAIALGILFISGQINPEKFIDSTKLYAYGSLRLSGEVDSSPLHKYYLRQNSKDLLVVGECRWAPFRRVLGATRLDQLHQPSDFESGDQFDIKNHWKPVEPSPLNWSRALGELIAISSLGEHSVLLAGPPGIGKSTLVRSIWECLPELSSERLEFVYRLSMYFKNQVNWRPFVNPHHSVSLGGMVGGSSQVLPGAVSQAHGGVLVLDELLEFDTRVIDALREPMESGSIKIFRNGKWQSFPAQDMVVATTNLCSCGYWLPVQKNKVGKCRCRSQKLRNYHSRLSGPMLDRFSILSIIDEKSDDRPFSVSELRGQVQEASNFQKTRNSAGLSNSKLNFDQLNSMCHPKIKSLREDYDVNERRWLHWLRVGRTVADLLKSKVIKEEHMMSAYQYTMKNFELLTEKLQA